MWWWWCRSMPPDGRIQKLVAMKRRPIMYYRPQAPQGSTFIKVCLLPMNTTYSALDSLPCSAYKRAALYKLHKFRKTGLWSLLSGSSLDISYLCVLCNCKLHKASMLPQKLHKAAWSSALCPACNPCCRIQPASGKTVDLVLSVCSSWNMAS